MNLFRLVHFHIHKISVSKDAPSDVALLVPTSSFASVAGVVF